MQLSRGTTTLVCVNAVLVSILSILVCLQPRKAHAQETEHPRPRFEQIWREDADLGKWGFVFRVFHDKETGQEFICAMASSDSISCWPTGRKWGSNGNR